MAAHFDLIVIGAGPAGAQAAAQAAALGRRVALVEREPYIGGAGLTTGTMPSKMLREAAATLDTLRRRALDSLTFALQPATRLADLMYNKDIVVEAAWGVIQRNVERLRIRVVHGTAAFQDPHTVRVTRPTEDGPAQETLTGDVILVATGSTSIRPQLFPFEHPQVRDSESVLTLDRLPQSLAIVGGGTIGCEYASIFNALGTRVTVIEARARLIAPVDGELAQRWQHHLERQGAQFFLNDNVIALETPPAETAGSVRLTLTSSAMEAEVVLVAVGRHGNVAGLNLAAAGLAANERGHLPVNDFFQTAQPHIYAAGDVVGWPALASASMVQARAVVAHAFENAAPPAAVYPVAVYTIPEIGMVGLSEEACAEQGQPCVAGYAYFERNHRAQMSGDTSGMLKLVFDPATHRLLGAQVMCEGAADLIHLAAQVLAAGGPVETFCAAVYNYPTLSEAYKTAALDGLERLRRAEAGPED
ncbi:MAG: Si-specific NAD(P)(+) transhydrogenase [Anaerolineales bacterium]|nr:Si-specific NAD(P)(+) transhydrogenase [Anaerolineales bacterium]